MAVNRRFLTAAGQIQAVGKTSYAAYYGTFDRQCIGGRPPPCHNSRMPPKAEFSWMIFFVMAVIFLGSIGMFFSLVRRWTLNRHWTALQAWARDHGFRHERNDRPAPPPLDDLHLIPQLIVSSGPITLIDFSALSSEDQTPIRVLHRQLEWPLAPGGLRPMSANVSLIDRFDNLQPFPLITSNERFLAFGIDSLAARRVADAMRTLLPADLGLLIHHRSMIIEFSARHFDATEFDRMIALSDQLIAHLPPPITQKI